MNLPKYKCHKIVQAAVILEVGTRAMKLDTPDSPTFVSVTPDWVNKTNPHIGDVFVIYDDGYQSVSPRAAFDAGYTPLVTSHQQRVREEKAELDARLASLGAFIDTSDVFPLLDVAERTRMISQAAVMESLSGILGERIAAFTNVQSTDAAARGANFWQEQKNACFDTNS